MGQDQPGGSGVWKPMGDEGIKLERAEDDDVEGHKFTERAQRDRVEGDDDDVEGHKQLT